MKKMNKKGFTLIELLAVIVILAIIMVIAVPQILNVIENSRKSAWESNVKMIADAIETNETIFTLPSSVTDNSKAISVYDANGCTASNIEKVADISTEDTTIAPDTTSGAVVTGSKCTIKVSPVASKSFSGQAAKTITCTKTTGCKVS